MKAVVVALAALAVIGVGFFVLTNASGGLKLEGERSQNGIEWVAAQRGQALKLGEGDAVVSERNGSLAFAAVLRGTEPFFEEGVSPFDAFLETKDGTRIGLMLTAMKARPNFAGVSLPANVGDVGPFAAFVVERDGKAVAKWPLRGVGKAGGIDINELPILDDVVVHDLRVRAAASTGMLFIRPEGKLPAGVDLAIQVGTSAGRADAPPNTMTPTKRIAIDEATFVHGYAREEIDTKVRVQGRLVWFKEDVADATFSNLKLTAGDGRKMGVAAPAPMLVKFADGTTIEFRIVHVVFGEMVGGRKGHFVQIERVSDKTMTDEQFQFLSGRRPGPNVPEGFALLQEPYHMIVEVEGDKTVGPETVVFFPGDVPWKVGDTLPPLSMKVVRRNDSRIEPLDLIVPLGPDTDLDAMDAYVKGKIGKTPPPPPDPMGTLRRNGGARTE